jgi:hypothetical protein
VISVVSDHSSRRKASVEIVSIVPPEVARKSLVQPDVRTALMVISPVTRAKLNALFVLLVGMERRTVLASQASAKHVNQVNSSLLRVKPSVTTA